MNKLIILLLLLFTVACNAQTNQPADNVTIINGKKYYLHVVKKGETLYSIAKQFKVTEKQIAESNFQFNTGLSNGETIKIPVVKGLNDNEEEVSSNDDFIYHKVKKDQTLYSISKIYNVDINDIFKNNPDAKSGINVGQTLKIPKDKKLTLPKTKPENDSKYIYHQVKGKETIFSLSQRYGVEVNKIMIENPDVRGALKAGQIVKIPRPQKTYNIPLALQPPKINKPVFYSLIPQYFINNIATPCDRYKFSNRTEPFNIALMLPLYLDENDRFDSTSTADMEDSHFYKNSRKMLEFYEGAMLAADSMRLEGTNIDIYIYDTGKDINKVKSILVKNEMNNMDLIVGPVYSELLEPVADFAKKHEINIVSPLSQKEEAVKFNPFVFQVNASIEQQVNQGCQFLIRNAEKNVVMLNHGAKDEENIMTMFKNQLQNQIASNPVVGNILIKEVNTKVSGFNRVADALSSSVENIIIISSSDEVYVTDMLTKLSVMADKHKIIIFGMPSWQKFKNIDLEYLTKLKMHYFSPTFIDYENQSVKNFIAKFHTVFKSEPSQYSYQGFDILYYFANVLKLHGRNFQYCIDAWDLLPLRNGLQTEFNFKRVNNFGGFENNGIFILQYDKNVGIRKIDLNKKYDYFKE